MGVQVQPAQVKVQWRGSVSASPADTPVAARP
jgi:hypothetical protein